MQFAAREPCASCPTGCDYHTRLSMAGLQHESISDLAKQVWQSFDATCTKQCSSHVDEYGKELSLDETTLQVEDAYARYRLWCGNLGALHADHRTTSLEHRLRNEVEIRGRIVDILSELIVNLQRGIPAFIKHIILSS